MRGRKPKQRKQDRETHGKGLSNIRPNNVINFLYDQGRDSPRIRGELLIEKKIKPANPGSFEIDLSTVYSSRKQLYLALFELKGSVSIHTLPKAHRQIAVLREEISEGGVLPSFLQTYWGKILAREELARLSSSEPEYYVAHINGHGVLRDFGPIE